VAEDHEALVAWLREAADELENAHLGLDAHGVPQHAADGTPYTLAARIALCLGYEHG
jgi:protoheme ferro-lyase